MPIKPGVQTKPISYEDFHSLDYEVMGIVFSIHRDLGRFWYENHFRRFIRYTSLKAIHWINFNHDNVIFKTILK